ncbi:MAG: GTPase HflX [Alphaproteobacteria bacterium]|nr:GTPase HflX [Alphaproteobacteria bacterium]
MVQPTALAGREDRRQIEDIIAEAQGLARAINLEVAETRTVPSQKIHAGAFFGKGAREAIAARVEELEPAIVIVNTTLSPVQQRNLEKEWNAKVIDRTGLILEIFGARAQTKEGRLQVDLAALEYQRSRLVRSWTHLERQRGGAGFMGGPGERQIEIDRRLIVQKIAKLKKELEEVRRTRDLGRKSRERVPFPVVALVGYTNAGKSTLFNRLTGAGVFAEDLPFATLDPTMRKIALPNHQDVILSDTVGFIADLPTHLVASFRATLEQVVYAEIIVHVIDVSRHDWQAQKQDVIDIMKDLGVEYETDDRIVEVLNKIDLLPENDLTTLEAKHNPSIVAISATSGSGIESLLKTIAEIASRAHQVYNLNIRPEDGKALAWLYAHGDVLERKDSEKKISVKVAMEDTNYNKFIENFGGNKKKA